MTYRSIHAALFIALLIAHSGGYAAEFSLSQNVVPLDWNETHPAGTIVLTVTGASWIGRANLNLDLSPFAGVEAVPRRPGTAFAVDGRRLDGGSFTVSIVRDLGSGGAVPDVLEILVILVPCEGEDCGPFPAAGFGEWTLNSANVLDLDYHPIGAAFTPGSWYFFTDLSGAFPVRVVDGETGEPVPGAQVALEGLVGGRGIRGEPVGGERTDGGGRVWVRYPPDPSFLCNPPEGAAPAVEAVLRAQPAPESGVPFKPVELTAPIMLDDTADCQFGEILIEVERLPNPVGDWTLR